MYLSKVCPFCGGTQIKEENGAQTCAYCLQPLYTEKGTLGEGYDKLRSGNWAGAAAFFREHLYEGAEAYWGLFSANNKIADGGRRGESAPVVYAYRPESFTKDPDYTALVSLCGDRPALLRKLEKAECARQNSLYPQKEYDVLVFCDEGGAKEGNAFADALTNGGFSVGRFTPDTLPDTATLRCAGAAYAFFAATESVEKLSLAAVPYMFMRLENAHTQARGIAKKPLKCVCYAPVPGVLQSDAAEFVPALDAAAELRRLRHLLPAGKVLPIVPSLDSGGGWGVPAKARSGETQADGGADAVRLRRLLSAGDTTGACAYALKLRKNGVRTAQTCFCEFLAQAGVTRAEDLINARTLSQEALRACDEALYYASAQEGAALENTLVETALKCIDRRKPQTAAALLDAAFRYESADAYAERVLGRLDAARDTLRPADYIALQKKVLSRQENTDEGTVLNRLVGAVDYALSRGDYDRADDLTESLLHAYPREGALYARKVWIENRVSGFTALYAASYPRLGENYTRYLALCPREQVPAILQEALRALLGEPEREWEKVQDAVSEVLLSGRERALCASDPFSSEQYTAAGERALCGGDFDAATDFFTHATARDAGNYRAYWGLLKSKHGCKTDRALGACDADIENDGNEFALAYRAALGRDEAFVRMAEQVARDRKESVKKDGHVFRASDFILQNGVCVRYIGKETENVLVTGVHKIGAGAFRGADCRSVRIDVGVAQAGDGAFACADVERVVCAGQTAWGAHPFRDCQNGAVVTAAGKTLSFPPDPPVTRPDWASLYGGGENNTAAAGKLSGALAYEKVCDAGDKTGGILLRGENMLFASDGALYAATLSGNRKRVPLSGETTGTGVLWRQYAVQPCVRGAQYGVTYINEQNKEETWVPLSFAPTRPLCVSGDTLLIAGGARIALVDLPRGLSAEYTLPERVTSVPCATANGFAAASDRTLFAVSTAGGIDSYALPGESYAPPSKSKICRDRLVGHEGGAYWFGRDTQSVFLGAFDGSAIAVSPIPRRIAEYMQTQPVFSGGKLYGGATGAIVATAAATTGERTFSVVREVKEKYAEIMAVGDDILVSAMEGKNARLRLRAVTSRVAVAVGDGIYVAKL